VETALLKRGCEGAVSNGATHEIATMKNGNLKIPQLLL
jgi:hypothetical protein